MPISFDGQYKLDYSVYRHKELVKEIVELITKNNLCLIDATGVLDSAKDALNYAIISQIA